MIDLTRRNFLLGVAASGLLVLQPPMLALAEVKKLLTKAPQLVTSSIKGIADGEIKQEGTPGPYDIFIENFVLTAETELEDITPIGAKFRQSLIKHVDFTVEAWVRSIDMNCVGRLMQLSLKASANTFYRGSFFITECRYDFTDGEER